MYKTDYKNDIKLSTLENLYNKLIHDLRYLNSLGHVSSDLPIIRTEDELSLLEIYLNDVREEIHNIQDEVKAKGGDDGYSDSICEYNLSSLNFYTSKINPLFNSFEFHHPIIIDNSIFNSHLSLAKNCKIYSYIEAKNCVFHKDLSVNECNNTKELKFGGINLYESQFNGSITFNNINMLDSVNINHCDIKGVVTFSNCKINGSINLSGSLIYKDVVIENCEFIETLSLYSSNVKGFIAIRDTQFVYKEAILNLNKVSCEHHLFISNTSFFNPPEIYNASLNGEVLFKNCIFINKDGEQSIRYKNLTNLFVDKGMHELAYQVHSHQLTSEAKGAFPNLLNQLRQSHKGAYFKRSKNPIGWFLNFITYIDLVQKAYLKFLSILSEVIFSILYIALNNRGQWPLLPLVWLIILTLGYAYYYQDIELLRPLECHIQSWECSIINWSEYQKGLFYSLQNTIWPLKVITPEPIFIESNFEDKVRSICQSLLSTLLFYFSFIGIRNKFKIEGLK